MSAAAVVLRRLVERWNTHQIALYLAAIAAGAAVGLVLPSTAPTLEHTIEPVLGLLLYATFLAVPMRAVGAALRDVRFLVTVIVANFVIVPGVVFVLSRFVTDDRGLLVGLLLVLLTPCIDYVIVFAGLAGAAHDRLLAAAPLLMLAQILLLPLYLLIFAGADVLAVVELGPFAEAFFVLIVIPLTAAAATQALSRRKNAARVLESFMAGAMVPLMMTTLAVVIGSQVSAIEAQALELARLVPLYVVFVAVAIAVGKASGAVARLDAPTTRAVVFSVATRNSLVVLPLALALPPQLGIAPLAVVTQTLVELLAMVIMVRLVPAFVPEWTRA